MQATSQATPTQTGPSEGELTLLDSLEGMLSIEEVIVSEDRMQVDGTLGNPLNAKLRMVSFADEKGCGITHTYCELPCEEPDAELDHILVELGFLNSVQGVNFIEP